MHPAARADAPSDLGEPGLSFRPRAVEAAALAGVLAGAASVYLRPLHAGAGYDEGVYVTTMRELRHGVAIGDVFSSQPPGFDWLLEAFGAVTGSLVTIRVLILCFALLGCVAAWWLGRSLAGVPAGLFPAGLLAIAPPWAVNATRLEAETPAMALAIGALALATRYRPRPAWRSPSPSP